jgi:hypothetical protein
MQQWRSKMVFIALLAGACAAEQKAPAQVPGNAEEAADPAWEPEPKFDDSTPNSTEGVQEPASKERQAPVFTEGMTVQQAMNAVSSDYDFIGIEEDVLAKPLREMEVFSPCKLKPSDKFTVKIAVWDGRVVGADVKSTNKALAQCIDGAVRKIEYKEKVESINTVELSL